METIYDVYQQEGGYDQEGGYEQDGGVGNKMHSAKTKLGAVSALNKGAKHHGHTGDASGRLTTKSMPGQSGKNKLHAAVGAKTGAIAALTPHKDSGVGLQKQKIMDDLRTTIGQCKTLSTQYKSFLSKNKEANIEIGKLVTTLTAAMTNLDAIGKDYASISEKIKKIKAGSSNRMDEMNRKAKESADAMALKVKESDRKHQEEIQRKQKELDALNTKHAQEDANLKKQQEADKLLAQEQAKKAQQEALAAQKATADAASLALQKKLDEATKAGGANAKVIDDLKAEIIKLNTEHKTALENSNKKHGEEITKLNEQTKIHDKEMTDSFEKTKNELIEANKKALAELGDKDAKLKANEMKAAQAKCDKEQQGLYGEIKGILDQVGDLSAQADADANLQLSKVKEVVTNTTEQIKKLSEIIKAGDANLKASNPAAAAKLQSGIAKVQTQNKVANTMKSMQTLQQAQAIYKSAKTDADCAKIDQTNHKAKFDSCKMKVKLAAPKHKKHGHGHKSSKVHKSPVHTTSAHTPAPAPAAAEMTREERKENEKQKATKMFPYIDKERQASIKKRGKIGVIQPVRRPFAAAMKAKPALGDKYAADGKYCSGLKTRKGEVLRGHTKCVGNYKKMHEKRDPKGLLKGGYRYGKKMRKKRTLKTKIKTQRLKTLRKKKGRKGKKSRRRKRRKNTKKRR